MRAWTIMGGALLVALGCSKGPAYVTADQAEGLIDQAVDTETPKCTPGLVQDCPCPMAASGVQVCSDDGKRWGACTDCWNALPPSGSSSSTGSGGAGLDVQQAGCDPMTMDVHFSYPGKKIVDLASLHLVAYRPALKDGFKYSQVPALLVDGEAYYQCSGNDASVTAYLAH
jgi:hypothetical protein